MFPEYYLERFPRGTTCRSHRQTASKPQDAVITPWSLKVKARAGNGSGAGRGGRGVPLGETGGEKNTSRKKTAKPHKKALKGETGAGRERRREEEETGGGWIRKGRGTRMRRRWRRKSCGHGCTERDSGCGSTCPFSRELRRVVIYGNKEWVGRKTRDARRPCRVSPRAILSGGKEAGARDT